MTRKEGVYLWTGTSKPDNLNDLEFPAHSPFFGRLFADDTVRIYIQEFPSIFEQEKTPEFDVFGKNGGYLYRLSLPFRPALIKSGYLYEIRRDEETGEVTVVRHKITNWNTYESTA